MALRIQLDYLSQGLAADLQGELDHFQEEKLAFKQHHDIKAKQEWKELEQVSQEKVDLDKEEFAKKKRSSTWHSRREEWSAKYADLTERMDEDKAELARLGLGREFNF